MVRHPRISCIVSEGHEPTMQEIRYLKCLKNGHGGNIDSAKSVGEVITKKALKKGVKNVVFDRGGFLYHGRIAALADAAREAGLKF